MQGDEYVPEIDFLRERLGGKTSKNELPKLHYWGGKRKTREFLPPVGSRNLRLKKKKKVCFLCVYSHLKHSHFVYLIKKKIKIEKTEDPYCKLETNNFSNPLSWNMQLQY